MKSLIHFLLISCAAVFVPGAEVDQVRSWSAGDAMEMATRLFAEMKERGARSNGVMLGEWGTHSAAITVRSGDGPAELHHEVVDFFVVLEGEATLVTGGELVNPTEKTPGEWRAGAIAGGAERRLNVGDVVYIPAGIPHQLLVKSSFKYLVIKARAQEPVASSVPVSAGIR